MAYLYAIFQIIFRQAVPRIRITIKLKSQIRIIASPYPPKIIQLRNPGFPAHPPPPSPLRVKLSAIPEKTLVALVFTTVRYRT